MSKYFPVYLNLDDRRVVVIGGGELGESKSLALINCGAKLVVIAKDVSEAVKKLSVSKEMTWVCRDYEYGDLEGAFIAIVTDTRDTELIAKISSLYQQQMVTGTEVLAASLRDVHSVADCFGVII